MCAECGCSEGAKATITDIRTGRVRAIARDAADHPREAGHAHDHAHGHTHSHSDAHDHHHGGDGGHFHDRHTHHHHDHDHGHSHHDHDHGRVSVVLERAILEKNDALAERNRAWLAGREVLMLNLLSAPGAGKTSLLERTLRDLKGRLEIAVIEGDQATANDGERIAAAGAAAVQVNTGTGCHLEADMIRHALDELKPRSGTIVMVENVGNLVCPALFDLGERAKITVLSVTEGEDKPLKYPHMFAASRLMLLNKTDLLPHVDFDVAKAIEFAREANPELEILEVSAKTGAGMDAWYSWLELRLAEVKA